MEREKMIRLSTSERLKEARQVGSFKIDRGDKTKPYTQVVFKNCEGVYFDVYGVVLKRTPLGFKEE